MEADLSSPLKRKRETKTLVVNKPKRIRKLIPGNCKFCNKWFADGRHLYAHIRIHTGEKPFVCSVCQRAFNQRSNFRRHFMIHKPNERKLFYCNVCERQYLNKQYYTEHMRAHEGLKPYVCHVCPCTFSFRNSLQRHLLKHEDTVKKYICEICKEGFDYLHLYNYHMRIHNPKDKPYACTLCKKAFAKSYHFYEHLMNLHNIKTAYQCKTCNALFSKRKQLEQHYLDDRGKCSKPSQEELDPRNESEQCIIQEGNTKDSDLCNKQLPGEKTLEKHSSLIENEILEASQNEQQIKIESIQCFANDITTNSDLSAAFNDFHKEQEIKTEPDENFESGTTINHYLSEDSTIPQIEYEEIEIGVNADLINPEPVENSNNSITNARYFCGICYKEISNNTSIQEHLLSHTQQYVYVCNNCQQCFNTKSLLAQHTCSNDTDVKLFECYICEETFSSKENLSKHLFTHTVEDTN